MANLPISQGYPNAAAAGTHVAGGVLDFHPPHILVIVFRGIQHVSSSVKNQRDN